MSRKLAAGLFGMACLAMAAMPSTALAQGRQGGGGGGGQGGPGGGGRGGFGMQGDVQTAQQVVTAMDVTEDEKTKIQGIVTDSRKEMQDAWQGMQQASPEERAQKMKDIQKMQSDTTDKIVDTLTDEQKTAFAPKFSTAVYTRNAATLTAMTKAGETFDTSDDNKTALKKLIEDTTKTFDDYKTQAAAVKDVPAAKALNTKMTDTMTEMNKQVRDILGDDVRGYMQAVRQAMPRQGRNGNAAGGGAGGGNGRRGTAAQPTTVPTI